MQPLSPQSTSGVPDQTGLVPNTVTVSKMVESGLKPKEFCRTGTVKWDRDGSALGLHDLMI